MVNELRGMFAETKGSFTNIEGFHYNQVDDYIEDFSPHITHMNELLDKDESIWEEEAASSQELKSKKIENV